MLPRTPAALGLVLILLLAVPPSAGTQSAAPGTSSPTAASGDFTGLVDIGSGRRLWLECHGQGSPTVILEAGLLSRSDIWSRDAHDPAGQRTMGLPGVAAFTRVGAYDRPGTIGEVNPDLDPDGPLFLPSRSDPVAMPRSAAESVHDLHALPEAADVPGPYVLVGHSYSGMLTRLYANTYPGEVVGMVLVDAFSEGLEAQMTAEQWTAYNRSFNRCRRHWRGTPTWSSPTST